MHNKNVKPDETTFPLKNVRNQVIQTQIAHFLSFLNMNKLWLLFGQSNTFFSIHQVYPTPLIFQNLQIPVTTGIC